MVTKVIWKAKSTTDGLGYLRLSQRSDGKTIVKNLSLKPIRKTDFNSNTQRVRKSFLHHVTYNEVIEDVYLSL